MSRSNPGISHVVYMSRSNPGIPNVIYMSRSNPGIPNDRSKLDTKYGQGGKDWQEICTFNRALEAPSNLKMQRAKPCKLNGLCLLNGGYVTGLTLPTDKTFRVP